ncbi:MAG TPA: ABC transporter transmembrane domain-containing protein [Actinomycetota bacterium]
MILRFTVGHRRWFLFAFVMLVIESAMSVFEAYPIGYLIDFLRGDRPALGFPGIDDPEVATIAVLTVAIVLLAVVNSAGDSLAEVFLARGGRSLGYSMRTTLYAHLQQLPLAFHHRRRTGDMLKRVTSDIEDVEDFVIDSLSDIAGSVMVLVGTLAFLLYQSWQVAVLAAVLVPVLSVISNHFSERIRLTSRVQKAREGDLASAAQEMLTSIPVVQTLGQSDYEQQRFEMHSRDAMAASLGAAGLEARFSWVIGVLESVTVAAVVWLGIYLVARGAFEVGTLIMFIILIQNMFKPTRKIIKEWTTIGKIQASVERVGEILARVPSVRDEPGAVEAPEFIGHLGFHDVTFAYRLDGPDDERHRDREIASLLRRHIEAERHGGNGTPGEAAMPPPPAADVGSADLIEIAAYVADITAAGMPLFPDPTLETLLARLTEPPDIDETPVALDEVSFEVRPGEVVAVVGPSGAGKSTIAQLIPRLYDPDEGEVRIDGRDVRSFTLDSLRRQISLVLQDTVLFQGTVAHNIGYGRPDATREQIEAAARDANAHGFITALPEGYETVLNERAVNLSGGERQRIAIARAIVRDAPILILDEPTTGLDVESSAAVIGALRRLMRDKTTVLISHDLDLIRGADRILVVHQGRIQQAGTHEELLREAGLYSSLHARRTRSNEVPAGNRSGTDHVTIAVGSDGEGHLEPLDPADVHLLLPRFPGLEQAFDDEAVRAHLQQALMGSDRNGHEIVRCHRAQSLYIPGESCLMRYEIVVRNGRGSTPALVNARIFPDEATTRGYLETNLAPLAATVAGRPELAAFPTPVALASPLNMVVSLFPLDGELPTLVRATDPHVMLAVLASALPQARNGSFIPVACEIDVGHYGRQHRCVVRYTVSGRSAGSGAPRAITMYGKVSSDRRGARTAAILPRLRKHLAQSSDVRVTVPRSLGFIEPLQLVLMEAIAGEPLIGRVVNPKVGPPDPRGPGTIVEAMSDHTPTLEALLETAGRVAAGIHTSDIDVSAHRVIDDDLLRLAAAHEAIAQVSPRSGEAFGRWLHEARLLADSSPPMRDVFSHGDFTHSQLLFEGEVPGLVDFDTVCRAEPALDLGQFTTYLRLARRKADPTPTEQGRAEADDLCRIFLDSYMRSRDLESEQASALVERVEVYELVSLLRLAFHSWQKMKSRRLELANELIDERLSGLARSTR